MSSESVKILVTGLPRCGKTTAITRIAAGLASENMVGFYTQEIRAGGKRKGFRWQRLDGAAGTLAHVDIKSRFKVGRYGVDVASFENEVVPILDVSRSDAELFILDEIGKMECFSGKFVAAVRELFASDKSVLATVAHSDPISEIKGYPGTELITLTRHNRDEIVSEIIRRLSPLGE
ncbi:MAG: NTPase [Phycisphaerales bacterium]|nr:MAG: NTPase [Phycisphaerales bacterium]